MEEQLFPQAGAPGGQKTPVGAMAAMPQLGSQITAIGTRLKLVEERYANLAKRNQLTEGSLMSFEHDIKTELRVLTKQLMDLRKRIVDINGKLDAINGELGTVVRKHEFATAERYLDMWQPMQFVSREEARRMLDEAIAARMPGNGRDGASGGPSGGSPDGSPNGSLKD